jgi:Ca2+-binding EF-hand superfamily protein
MAQKEIKRFRYFCGLIAANDLDQYIVEKGNSLSTRVRLNDQEENRALGVLMAVKEKMSKRFISLREAFSKIDEDNSGYVDKQEFMLACQFWGLYLEEEDFCLMLSYQSGDEVSLKEGVDYKAFINMLTIGTDEHSVEDGVIQHQASSDTLALTGQLRKSLLDEVKTIQKAFELVDEDNSGYIDVNEMARIFEMFHVTCTREILDDLFNTYDTDEDNKLSYEEFARVFEDMTGTDVSAESNDQFQTS